MVKRKGERGAAALESEDCAGLASCEEGGEGTAP